MDPVSSFHVLGAGKVAQTLAVLWQRSGRFRLAGVWNRTPTAAQRLCQRIGGGLPYSELAALPPAEVIVLGVRDDALEMVAEQMAALPWLTERTTVLHFSGAKSSGALAGIGRGCQSGSLHPVFAFADIDAAINSLPGHHCAIEGSVRALPVLQALAQAAGLRFFEIAAEAKSRYHAGLSVSANFLVTLNAYARQIIARTGLPETVAQALVQQLMQQNLNQLASLPPVQALTGPIVRGDEQTVAGHLQVLATDETPLYLALAKQTILLAQPRLGEAQIAAMTALLTQ